MKSGKMTTILELKNITAGYETVPVLKNVNLKVEEQDFIAGFQTKLPPDFYRHSDLTVCRDFRQIHTSRPFYSLELKFSLSLLILYPMCRGK